VVTNPLKIVSGTDWLVVWLAAGDGPKGVWFPIPLPYTQGDPSFPPSWVAPHQPRLDWQMWFAALGAPASAPWLVRFAKLLLDGSPQVSTRPSLMLSFIPITD
jgi:hypothetical protein